MGRCCIYGVLLQYPTTTGFQWGHLQNGPYTYTVKGGNGIGYSKTSLHILDILEYFLQSVVSIQRK